AVIGVGSTIGKEGALTFAREGAQVLAVDPDASVANDVAQAVAAQGGQGTPLRADFEGIDGPALVAAACGRLWGHLDVLFTCSALEDYWHWGSGEDTLDKWERVINVNLLSPVLYTRALLPLLAKSDAGSIVYLGSIDGVRGNPNLPAYSVAKGGLTALTHVMAAKGAAHGVRVNCIATGAINQAGTGAGPRVHTPEASTIMRLTPLGRRATRADVATAALFFASGESAYVTGTVLPVEGGRLAATPGTAFSGPPTAGTG